MAIFNGKIHYFYGHFPLLCGCSPEGSLRWGLLNTSVERSWIWDVYSFNLPNTVTTSESTVKSDSSGVVSVIHVNMLSHCIERPSISFISFSYADIKMIKTSREAVNTPNILLKPNGTRTSHGSTSSAPLTEPCHTLHRAGIRSRFLRALCPCAGSPSSPLKPSLALFMFKQRSIWCELPEKKLPSRGPFSANVYLNGTYQLCPLCPCRETISDGDQALLETRMAALHTPGWQRIPIPNDSLSYVISHFFFFIPFFPIISIISLLVLSFFLYCFFRF